MSGSESLFESKFPVDQVVDATGLRCPLPLLRAKQAISGMASQQVLLLIATDAGADRDIPAWVSLAHHHLLLHTVTEQHREFYIQKQ